MLAFSEDPKSYRLESRVVRPVCWDPELVNEPNRLLGIQLSLRLGVLSLSLREWLCLSDKNYFYVLFVVRVCVCTLGAINRDKQNFNEIFKRQLNRSGGVSRGNTSALLGMWFQKSQAYLFGFIILVVQQCLGQYGKNSWLPFLLSWVFLSTWPPGRKTLFPRLPCN